jgi:ABC-type branched-subunit amino acid transport system substrate-binding protein
MKNAVIAVLTALCGTLLLQALGVFDFGPFIDREHRAHYTALRARAVDDAPEYILGAVYNAADWADAETLRGVRLAVDVVNGGNPAKRFRLESLGIASSRPLNNAAVQGFADAPDTVAVIGPFVSFHIPASRALTQFYGLPLVSPKTVVSEKLPALDPDNFVTVFPPLELWVRATLDHMEKQAVRKLLILSSEAGTYSDIVCTVLERSSRNRRGFDQIFRLNYQRPLRREAIERLMRSRAGEQEFEAVFFGGALQDFTEFLPILKDNAIHLPVYGHDDLYVPEVTAAANPVDLYLPRAVWRDEIPGFEEAWRERHGGEPSYHALLGAKTVFMLAEVLKSADGYNAGRIVDSLRKIVRERLDNPETAPQIIVDAFPAAHE